MESRVRKNLRFSRKRCPWQRQSHRSSRISGRAQDSPEKYAIFEPFFTTKPVGKGTGLGLATVYGVVRQSAGFIQARSEPGSGTYFGIDFPVVTAPQSFPLSFESAGRSPLPESATILLVDDETALVHAIGEFLGESGFLILDAFSSRDTLDLAKKYPGRIDVLVTDVVMPGPRGPDLHSQIVEFQPEIRVLFMSGYAEGLSDMELPPGTLSAETFSLFRAARKPAPAPDR